MATLAAPFAAETTPGSQSREGGGRPDGARALLFAFTHPARGFSARASRSGSGAETPPLLHIGIYAYRLKTLRELAAPPPAPPEIAERLEQLRALWNGIEIHVAVGDYHSIGIDTPEDLSGPGPGGRRGRNTTRRNEDDEGGSGAMIKFVFVTGGVVSSLGKGIAASAIGSLLKSRGLAVTLQKFDPYLNVDPGTMSPYQHGEVYVTDDGAETDLDVGHYERFLGVSMGRENNVTAGQIYDAIIQKERRATISDARSR